MQNINFEGLEEALKNECYIKVYGSDTSGSIRNIGVIEKKDKIFKKKKTITRAVGGNVIRTLSRLSISYCHIDEIEYVNKLSLDELEDMFYNETAIDKILKRDCNSLQLYRLSNGQILSAICTLYNGESIPIKAIISDDVLSGFEFLNATINCYDNIDDFMKFVDSQVLPIKEHKKR